MIYAALVAATVAWGGGFVAIKQLLDYLSPLELVLMRFIPSALSFAVLLWLRERETLYQLLRQEWLLLCLIGLFSVVVAELAVTFGQQWIPGGTGSLILASNPVFVVLLSALFLGERVTWTRALGIGLSSVGVFIVVRFASGGEIGFGYLGGVLVTMLTPLSAAISDVISRPLLRRYTALPVFGSAVLMGTLPLLLTARPTLLHKLQGMPIDGWLNIAFLSLGGTVAGFLAYGTALKHLGPSRTAAFSYLVPVWGVASSCLLLDEPFTPALVIGAMIIISGVVLVNR